MENKKITITAKIKKADIYDLFLSIEKQKIINIVFEGDKADLAVLKFSNVIYSYDHKIGYEGDETAKEAYNNLDANTQRGIKLFGDSVMKKIISGEIEQPKTGLAIGEYNQANESRDQNPNDIKNYTVETYKKLLDEANKLIKSKEEEILDLTLQFNQEQDNNLKLIEQIKKQQFEIGNLKIEKKEYQQTLERLNPKIAQDATKRISKLIKKAGK